MKTVTLTVRVKMDTDNEEQFEKFISQIETPIEDEDGMLNSLVKYGYEITIMDRDDK